MKDEDIYVHRQLFDGTQYFIEKKMPLYFLYFMSWNVYSPNFKQMLHIIHLCSNETASYLKRFQYEFNVNGIAPGLLFQGFMITAMLIFLFIRIPEHLLLNLFVFILGKIFLD